MCGIAGIVSNNNALIADMLMAISSRGPDGDGYWLEDSIPLTLGHKRLSIIDLSVAGHQPMHSHNKRYTITYNGEIYNHIALRAQLEKISACNWVGHSDTEILLQAIETWGIDGALDKTEGMFAFALFDNHHKALYLVRDPFGEKPLFFSWIKNKLAFASQIKALECLPQFDSTLEENTVARFLMDGFTSGMHTCYKNTYKVPAGHYIKLDQEDLNTVLDKKIILGKLFCYIKKNNNRHAHPIINHQKSIHSSLRDSVEKRLIADVPVGIFLSGGIDSSLIAALANEVSTTTIHTFTIGFKNKKLDEAPFAAKISAHLKLDHHELYLDENDIFERIQNLHTIIDEPFGDTSIIPTSILCEFSSKQVKVALTGDGGDELFGGYTRYKNGNQISALRRIFPNWTQLNNIVREQFCKKNRLAFTDYKMARFLKIPELNRYLYRALSNNPTELNRSYIGANLYTTSNISLPQRNNVQEHSTNGNTIQSMMQDDQTNYLPDNILVKSDRASMAFGLETRAPYLTPELLATSRQLEEKNLILHNQGKPLLKNILLQYIPKTLVERPKQGFTPPLADWLRGPLYSWADQLLSQKNLITLPAVDVEFSNHLWRAHNRKHIDASFALWPLLSYANWCQTRGIHGENFSNR